MDWPPEAEAWIRAQGVRVQAMELMHQEPWAHVWRVTHADGVAWLKVCAPMQAFEPRLTGELYARWPDHVSEVLAHDDERGWLLLADAGTPVRLLGNPPELWQAILPRYAEMQRGEAVRAVDHVGTGVPDQTMATWTTRYEELLGHDLPLEQPEIQTLVELQPRFNVLSEELRGASALLRDTIQHDDLHMNNLYLKENHPRVLDWGDSSISHPFISLVVTFRFLDEFNHLSPDDAWFARLRDAYLEPWGPGLQDVFALAMRVGGLVHCFGWMRQRDMLPADAHESFNNGGFGIVLRRAIAHLQPT